MGVNDLEILLMSQYERKQIRPARTGTMKGTAALPKDVVAGKHDQDSVMTS